MHDATMHLDYFDAVLVDFIFIAKNQTYSGFSDDHQLILYDFILYVVFERFYHIWKCWKCTENFILAYTVQAAV